MVVAGFEHVFAQIPQSHRSGVELLLRQRLVTQTSSGKLVPSSDVIDSLGQPNCPVSPNLARLHVADLRRARLAETASSCPSH
jgi:hypothetical protein